MKRTGHFLSTTTTGLTCIFKVITVFEERGFSENAIYGDLEDIYQLGEIVENKLKEMKVGDIESLRSEYSPESEYEMKLILESDGFDPVSVDGWIKMKESEQDGAGQRR